jgi:hypothetical protein
VVRFKTEKNNYKQMKKQLFTILLLALALVSCHDDNEKAMQDALNKAGIKITQQDSIIASQTYRCNYILTYTTDTTNFELKNGVLIPSTITTTMDGTPATYAYHWLPGGVGFWSSKGYPTSSSATKREYKHMTVAQMDSIVLSLRKLNVKKYNAMITAYYESKDTIGKFNFATRLEYVEVNLTHTVEKNYNNLYNIQKQQ